MLLQNAKEPVGPKESARAGLTSGTIIRMLFHAVLISSLVLLVGFVAVAIGRGFLGRPLPVLSNAAWIASAFVGVLLASAVWDRTWDFPGFGLYLFGLALAGMVEIARGFPAGRFVIWGTTSDLATFLIIAALTGWCLPQLPRISIVFRIPNEPRRCTTGWFFTSQAILLAINATLAVVIVWDFTFDGVGEGIALLGLSGRLISCSTLLMLLGTAILMAWQAKGLWRAGWQYIALVTTLLFTSSIGWSGMANQPDADFTHDAWHRRGIVLIVSASMLTVMTKFGLPRVLPRNSDWGTRAARISPYFGGLALSVLALVMIYKLLLFITIR